MMLLSVLVLLSGLLPDVTHYECRTPFLLLRWLSKVSGGSTQNPAAGDRFTLLAPAAAAESSLRAKWNFTG